MANNRELSQFASTVGHNGGKVGIGSDNPQKKLDVAGDVKILDNSPRLEFYDANAANNTECTGGFEVYDASGNRGIFMGATESASNLHFGIRNDEKMRITYDGNVGIGTEIPGAKLEVFDATSNTILNVKSGDAGAVLNLIDDSARSSIEQNGTTLKISSDTGAEDASSDIRLQVDGSTKMHIESDGQVVINRPSGAVLANTSSQLEVYNSTENLIFVSNSTAATSQDAGIMFAPANNVYGGKIIVTSDEDFSTSANRTAHMAFHTRQDGTASEKLRIAANGNMGLGETTPLGKLHVKTGDSGTSSVGASADELVIEGSGHAGMTILSGDNQQGIINFGETDDNNIGGITYNHGDNDLLFRTSNAERLRITSAGHLVYDTNKGGIYNFDKACASNTSTNIFRINNEHGAHCFTIYMTCSNSGNSVSKIYNVACQFGAAPTISSAADTGGYGANNFSLTGSVSSSTHTFAISITGAAATISCTVVLGSMNTSATVTVL